MCLFQLFRFNPNNAANGFIMYGDDQQATQKEVALGGKMVLFNDYRTYYGSLSMYTTLYIIWLIQS